MGSTGPIFPKGDHRLRRAAFILAIWAGWAGCLCQSPVDPNGHVPGKCSNAGRIEVQKTDILFVVDDSESMADKQAEVARELPIFVQELSRQTGVQQDFQWGVVTTSVYQYAELINPCDGG